MALELTLGSVTFTDYEIPERIEGLGGEQMAVIRQFIGGRRKIQTLGPVPHALSWSGILIGTDALTRHRTMDRMRVTGELVKWNYGPFEYEGIVKRFNGTVQSEFYVSYRIEFWPESDLTSPAIPLGSPLPEVAIRGVAFDVRQQMTASTLPLTTRIADTVINAIDTVETQIRNHGGLLVNIEAAIRNPTLETLFNVAGSLANVAQSDMGQVPSSPLAGNILGAADLFHAAAVALDTESNLQQLAIRFQDSAPTASDTRIAYVRDPNLFELAAKYYGDAELWDLIASANGLTDPMPKGTFRLYIPEE